MCIQGLQSQGRSSGRAGFSGVARRLLLFVSTVLAWIFLILFISASSQDIYGCWVRGITYSLSCFTLFSCLFLAHLLFVSWLLSGFFCGVSYLWLGGLVTVYLVGIINQLWGCNTPF